ncbi:hypothetical protein GGR52DRAFT_536462 [Hypoxylon sp. FL1284]|nr:hypothetical protein GGR52DRAFT_536462 [Hypoxylon sp. FL1284]
MIRFFAKYYRAIPEGSRFWHETRDTVSAYDIQQTLTDSWVRWCTISATARRLESAIDKIPDPKRTNKVVCLGLGRILLPLVEPDVAEWGPNNMLASRNLSQHLAAIAITKLLENKTGQQIALYAADPDYKAQHKSALETLSLQRFTVLDPSYGKHEVFTIIDDSTLLFDMAGGPPCPTLSLVQEYARPVAIITHEVPRDGVKYQDRQWFELTERDGTKVQVPGYGVDLLSPHGWDIEDGHFPRRVRDMLVDEYEMEKEFPAGEKDTLPFKLNDLANPEERHQGNAKHSVYWRPGLRLYVRKY